MTDEHKANLSEDVKKAIQCKTPEELIELAKNEGVDLILDEAQVYLAEFDDFKLDRQQFKSATSSLNNN